MKQIILSLSVVMLCSSVFAQEAADKKFQAGLITGLGMNFVTMNTTKLKTDGIGTDRTFGANLNFSFNETIGLVTGVEIDFETLKYSNAGDSIFYYFNDKNIVNKVDVTSSDVLYNMTSRKQKPVYISIPAMLLFRTKFIGYFRYFGKFGVRTSILASNKTNDSGQEFDPLSGAWVSRNNENMISKGEMLFMKAVGGFAGGAEWNFNGSTCLVAEMGFYFGFTPLYFDKKEDKRFLFQNDGGTNAYFSNAAKHNQLRLKVSILF